MFFVVVGTNTEHVINEFALDARINIQIFQCHTVTNGTDLRRSPQVRYGLYICTKCPAGGPFGLLDFIQCAKRVSTYQKGSQSLNMSIL